MAIAEGIAAAKAALDVTKLVTDLVNRPNPDAAEIQRKVHEMLIHIVNAQTALAEAQVELSDIRQKLEDREALRALDADMEFTDDGHVYLKKSDQTQGKTIRYCPLCWKSDSKDVPLAPGIAAGSYTCPLHEHTYYTREYHDAVAERKARDAAARTRSHPGPWS
jgi:hypothetical protein